MIEHAAAIRDEAETRAGELLLEMQKNKDVVAVNKAWARLCGKHAVATRERITEPPTVPSLGISKTQSSRNRRQGREKVKFMPCRGRWRVLSRRRHHGPRNEK